MGGGRLRGASVSEFFQLLIQISNKKKTFFLVGGGGLVGGWSK